MGVGLALLQGRGPDVGGDPKDLLEPLPLVQVLGEPQPGSGASGQGLRPPEEFVLSGQLDSLASRP
jgi:hypothetical protein